MPRKRSKSLVGFFSRLLPSHRPEQGNTLRSVDNSRESAYRDLGIDTEELTQWNLAEDVSPKRRAELILQGHRRAASLGLPKLESQIAAVDLEPRKSENQSGALSASQTHALLQSKEKTRKQRRDLKASGDFLPVTGYDPRSGEWNVLTPTDTLSSDPTSPSTNEKMASLAQQVRNAKQAYEQAKNTELSEREKVKLEKAQAKLAKIEKRKTEVKSQQGGGIKWSQHGRNWSSAAEPSLSPIAQSLISNADDMTLDPGLVSRVRGPRTSPLKLETTAHQEDNVRFRERHPSNSGDTTIHTPTRQEQSHVSFARPVVESSLSGLMFGEGELGGKVPFLWLRRRPSRDPGRRNLDQVPTIAPSNAEIMMRSRSLDALSELNHFIDVKIPDPRLGILTREGEEYVMSKSPRQGSPPTLFPPRSLGTERAEYACKENRMSVSLTDLNSSLEGCSRSISGATATSFPLKRNELTMPPSGLQKLDLNLSGTDLTKDFVREYLHSKLDMERENPVVRGRVSEDTLVCKTMDASQNHPSEPNLTRTGPQAENVNALPALTSRESAFIPITITTGYDLGLSSRLSGGTLCAQLDDHEASRNVAQMAPSPQRSHDRSCTAPMIMQNHSTPDYHPDILLSGLQRPEHYPRTLQIDTASNRDRTIRKSYLSNCSPKTPRLCNRTHQENEGLGSNFNLIDHPTKTCQQTNLRHASDSSMQEVAIQAAARTAMLKSRTSATGAATTTALSRPHSQQASLIVPSYKTPWADYPKTSSSKPKQQQQAILSETAVSVDTGDHSSSPLPNEDIRPDAVAMSYVICLVFINVLLEMGVAWWNFVRPVFDKESGLWRRRRKQMSTMADLGVFLSAGLFCTAGAVVIWYSFNLLQWLLF